MSKKIASLTIFGTIFGIVMTILLTQTLLQPLIERLDWFVEAGSFGMLVFFLLYIPMGLLLVPASFHKFVAGMLFGFWIGWAIAWIGAMVGAILPFILARRALGPWAQRKLQSNRMMASVENAIVEDGWVTVWLTRMSLIIPYAGLNYGLGATRLKMKDYLIGNTGMIIPGVLYAWWGSQADDIADAAKNGGTMSYWLAIIASAVITVVMIVHLRNLTVKHLKMDESGLQNVE